MSTFSHLKKYTSSRYADSSHAKEASDKFDMLSERDANLAIIAMFSHRSQEVQPNKTITGSHFHSPSGVGQRTFHAVDEVVFNAFPTLSFAEMSPVQPLGLNTIIGGLSQNKILATVRSSEVNADITTSLFRLAYSAYIRQKEPIVELGGISRILRAQSYNPKTKFLPHFCMFGHVSVGRQGISFKMSERGHLLRHICNDFDLMNAFKKYPDSTLKTVSVELGDARIMQKLVATGKVDGREIRRHTTDPDYHVFKQFNIDLPETLMLDDPSLYTILKTLELPEVATELHEFYETTKAERPDIAQTMSFTLSRIADSGYYRGTYFNIFGSDGQGLHLPIANGGYTDWAYKINRNPREICIISGIGEELIARYFFPNKDPKTLNY